jgi:hypothetical protein
VAGIDPVRDFATVRPATQPPGRLVASFLAWSQAWLARRF